MRGKLAFALAVILLATLFFGTGPALAYHESHFGHGDEIGVGQLQWWWDNNPHNPKNPPRWDPAAGQWIRQVRSADMPTRWEEYWYWQALGGGNECFWHGNVYDNKGSYVAHASEDWWGWNPATRTRTLTRAGLWRNSGASATRDVDYLCIANPPDRTLAEHARWEPASISITADPAGPVGPSDPVCLTAVVTVPAGETYSLSWSNGKTIHTICDRYAQPITLIARAINRDTGLDVATSYEIRPTSPAPSPPPDVTISPRKLTTYRNQTDRFDVTRRPVDLALQWSVGDGLIMGRDDGSGYALVSWSTLGEKSVTVTGTDATGRSDSDTATVQVINRKPTVSISPSNPAPIRVGDEILFTATGTDADRDSLGYSWSVTGSPAVREVSDTQKVYKWSSANTYTVTVTADDRFGGVHSASATISVEGNNPPTGTLKPPFATVIPGEVVRFEATGSDPDGDAVTLTWYKDGVPQGIPTAAPSFKDLSWNAPGDHFVRVNFSDGKGGSVDRESKVKVIQPKVSLQPDSPTPAAGESLTFTATAADFHPGDTLTHTWTVDGQSQVKKIGLVTTQSYVWSAPGIYKAKVTVTDQHGASAWAETTVTVRKPRVALEPENPTVNAGHAKTFTATAAEFFPGDVLTHTWSADGQVPVTKTGSVTTQPYSWSAAGLYKVRVTVADRHGGSAFTETTVKVLPPAPSVEMQPLDPALITGDSLVFTATAANFRAGDTLTHTWSADGQVPVTAIGSVTTQPYTWNAPGFYKVKVTVTDQHGGSAFNETMVTVLQPGVTLQPTSPTLITSDNQTFTATAANFHAGDTITHIWRAGGQAPVTRTGIATTQPYTWTAAGEYKVSVTVTDTSGASAYAETTVIVKRPWVLLSPANPKITRGKPLTFAATTGNFHAGDKLTHTWTADSQAPVTLIGADTTKTYTWNAPGTYKVTVTVTDEHGALDSSETLASVSELGTVELTPKDPTIFAGDTITFTAKTAKFDPHDTLTHSWSADGQRPATLSGRDTSQIYKWTVPGTYAVEVFVSDEHGGLVRDTTSVEVLQPPAVTLVPLAPTIYVEEAISFTATARDFFPDDTLTQTWTVKGHPKATQTGATISRTYDWREPGDYTVTVDVRDEHGGKATVQTTVRVKDLHLGVFFPRSGLRGQSIKMRFETSSDVGEVKVDLDQELSKPVEVIWGEGDYAQRYYVHNNKLTATCLNCGTGADTLVWEYSFVLAWTDTGPPEDATYQIKVTAVGPSGRRKKAATYDFEVTGRLEILSPLEEP